MSNILYIGSRLESLMALISLKSSLGVDCLDVLAVEDTMLHTSSDAYKTSVSNFYLTKRSKSEALSYLQYLLDNKPYNVVISVGFPYVINSVILEKNSETNFYNIHPHILPKWKGLSPIRDSITQCETRFGATFHCMSDKVDEGLIIYQYEFEFDRKELDLLYNILFSIVEPHVMIAGFKLLKEEWNI